MRGALCDVLADSHKTGHTKELHIRSGNCSSQRFRITKWHTAVALCTSVAHYSAPLEDNGLVGWGHYCTWLWAIQGGDVTFESGMSIPQHPPQYCPLP